VKQPTPAAWKKLFAKYEECFNAFLPHLTEEERGKLFDAHDVLRLRASGGREDE